MLAAPNSRQDKRQQMSWLFDLLRAPGDLLRVTSVPPPPPEPRLGMLFGTAVVLCSGVLATACLRKRFLRALFRSIFSPGDAAARDAAALIKSLSRIDIEADDHGDHSANPALQELQRTEEDYVEDLRALANAKAGLVSGGLLSDEDAKLLFSNAPVLLELHEVLLSMLHGGDATRELEQPSNEIVAKAFASNSPYFLLCAPRRRLPRTLPCPPCISLTARLLSDAGGAAQTLSTARTPLTRYSSG